MNFLFTISLRNLFRQRRRSVLLGTAIAFGTAILVLANAFAHGISEVIFDEIVSYVTGHVSVSFTKNGNLNSQIFPDGERIKKIIHERIPDVKRVEEAIGTFTRAIGNGKADNVIMVGIDPSAEADEKEMRKLRKNFKILEGSFESVSDTTVENPVAIAVKKAKSLNVKVNDIIRVRFQDIHGRTQAARLTVTTIFKPSNAFMSEPVFVEVHNLRKLLGYGPHDIAQLYLTIDNPKKMAKRIADSLHAALSPPLAVMDGALSYGNGTDSLVTLLCLRTDSASLAVADSAIKRTEHTTVDSQLNRRSVIMGLSLATKLHVQPGDTCRFTWDGKFDEEKGQIKLIVSSLAETGCGLDGNVVLVNEKEFYKAFYDVWPKSTAADRGIFLPDSSAGCYPALGGEWLLLERQRTTKDVMKMYREIAQNGWKAITVNVGSMYETASMVLNLEAALNMITLVCVMLLFFIILIGVINTLRMTIRERTREIGTVRAIGMQRNDVRNSFLIETGLLALLASLAGTIVAFVAMAGISLITFKSDDNPLAMLLVEGHIHFAPTPVAVIGFVVLIVCIALVTAYFPARRAAAMRSADALRHFE
jgi:ABC-type lipoprotein release transport system permease subunit